MVRNMLAKGPFALRRKAVFKGSSASSGHPTGSFVLCWVPELIDVPDAFVQEAWTWTCKACNRPFTWRKKWARDWNGVRYCSEACRRGKGQVRKGVS